MLTEHKTALLAIADELLAREVLDADQVLRLVQGLPLQEPVPVAIKTVGRRGRPSRARSERQPIVPSLGASPVGQE